MLYSRAMSRWVRETFLLLGRVIMQGHHRGVGVRSVAFITTRRAGVRSSNDQSTKSLCGNRLGQRGTRCFGLRQFLCLSRGQKSGARQQSDEEEPEERYGSHCSHGAKPTWCPERRHEAVSALSGEPESTRSVTLVQ